MAVKRLEDAARRLVKKIADLALGPVADPAAATRTPPAAAQPAARTAATSPVATATAATPPQASTPTDAGTHDETAARAATVPDATSAEASPIRTRTLARLLAAQGYTARALAMYDALLAASPDDLTLVEEASALRAPSGAPVGVGIGPIHPPSAVYGRDQITAAVVDGGTLFVHWESTPAGAARARSVAESAGRSAGERAPEGEPGLALRVVVLHADAAGVVRSEALERADAPSGGETFVTGLPAEATLFAALGVRRGERFVAITHAPAAYTPPARPAALPALEFAPPPPPPASALDATPPATPRATPLAPTRAAEVLRQAEALVRPAEWPHASELAAAQRPERA